ncbi:hypothetical protein FGO68_gene6408 [Halteria grandinella]|uniref:Uncharacterized protein n=1 Tax=Halteria grandinella TaxID=5974 RepID=A0A8J8P5V3_HALGN|nr:hypothetical protein FGO68_gene6408 [Halteria grandinella]
MAFDIFLNRIYQLNVSLPDKIKVPSFILKSAPHIDSQSLNQTNLTVSQINQDISFMLLNGIRVILYKTHEVEDYLHTIVTNLSLKHNKTEFLLIMLAGLALCTTMMVLIIQKIANTDRSNKEILGIFALLSIEEIDRIYGICDKFIDRLDNHEDHHQAQSDEYGEANSIQIEKFNKGKISKDKMRIYQ